MGSNQGTHHSLSHSWDFPVLATYTENDDVEGNGETCYLPRSPSAFQALLTHRGGGGRGRGGVLGQGMLPKAQMSSRGMKTDAFVLCNVSTVRGRTRYMSIFECNSA